MYNYTCIHLMLFPLYLTSHQLLLTENMEQHVIVGISSFQSNQEIS